MRVALFTSHANDPLSYLIKAVDRGGYVHAALEVEPGIIIESYWPNVRERALAPQELAGIDFYAIEGLTEEIEARILDYCRKAIAAHETYSVLNLFRFAPEFRQFLGEATDNPTHPSAFCSQFVFCAIKDGGGINLLNAPAAQVAPNKLAWSPFLTKA